MARLSRRLQMLCAAADTRQALVARQWRHELRSLSDAELEERIAAVRAEIGEEKYRALCKEAGCPED